MRAFALAFLILTASGAWAQTADVKIQTPVPYTDAEFDPLALKLRRAEIIAVGVFPLAYLFSGLGYDYYYYFSRGYPSDNIPWPVGGGTSQWTDADHHDELQQKNITLVSVSLAAGLLIAAVDWWLGE